MRIKTDRPCKLCGYTPHSFGLSFAYHFCEKLPATIPYFDDWQELNWTYVI